MSIWELQPIDTSHNDWRASDYLGRLVIRADSESDARHIANHACGIAVERLPGRSVAILPWSQEVRASARDITDDGQYPDDGLPAILDPAEYDGNWPKELFSAD
jgi:hypothetical protein